MRFFCILLFLLYNGSSFSQTGIELSEFKILYAGYPNHVQPITSKKGNIQLLGKNCTITKNEDGSYIVVPEFGKRYLQLILLHKKDTIFSREYSVRKLPDPNLYFGAVASGRVNPEETRLFARYGDETHLNASFSILNWIVVVGNDSIHGTGNRLQNVDQLFQSQNRDTILTIITTVLGPDKIERQLKNQWIMPLQTLPNRVGYKGFKFSCSNYFTHDGFKSRTPDYQETLIFHRDNTYSYTIHTSKYCIWVDHEDTGTYIQKGNKFILNSSDTGILNASINLELLEVTEEELNGYYEHEIFCDNNGRFLVFISNDNKDAYRNRLLKSRE